MDINEDKLKHLDSERPIYDERQDQRTFQSRYQSDLIKGIVEIIKNGVDAYINDKGEENCNQEEIKIVLERLNTKNPIIKIINFAEGMNSEEFKKALRIGADTSGNNESVTGAHGYGMKEASWAFKTTRIITVKDKKYSVRLFYWDKKGLPKYAWDIDTNNEALTDIPLDYTINTKTYIQNKGTYFEATVPDNISCPRPDTLMNQLSNNILLRTINQSNKFKITIEYTDTKTEKILKLPIKYDKPDILEIREDRKAVEVGKFSFEYPNYGIVSCRYEIFLATRELSPTGDTREAGLLVCAGPFSVLDCTLFGYGDRISSRFFGKIILSGSIRKIYKKEKIIDDKRESGLLTKTPLYKNLYAQFHKILGSLINKERKRLNKKSSAVSEAILDNKIDLIKEFNKIDIQETEESLDIKGDIKFLPGENGIRFCVPDEYLRLVEKQDKKVHIVIDVTKIPLHKVIKIVPDKAGIDITPHTFEITAEQTDKNNVFKKKINFKSSVIDIFSVSAHIEGMFNKANLNVESVKDARLHIKSALEFVPCEQDIVAGKSKNFSLVMNFGIINKNEKISFKLDDMFIINKQLNIKDCTQIDENYYELIVRIHCSGKPKQKGKLVQAIVGEHSADLKLDIIHSKDRHLKGDFEGIDEDKTEDPDVLGYWDNKIIYVCVNHPILRHYKRSKDGEKSIAYRVLFSDIIIREFCNTLARKKIKTSFYPSAEDWRVRYNEKYEDLFKKHAQRLHKLCINPKYIEMLRVK